MLNVVVNGTTVALDDGTTAADTVRRFSTSTEGVAVAVNGDVVPRSQWGRVLHDGDHVEIVTAAAGG